MANLLIVGGAGQQGRVVARELGVQHQVTVLDVQNPKLDNVKWHRGRLWNSPTDSYNNFFCRFDLVVNCLPATQGITAQIQCLWAKVPCIDLSFVEEDLRERHTQFKDAGSLLVPDCGLSPGLSNLAIGHDLHATEAKHLDRVEVHVGGVALDRNKPYGYVTTWALPDLEQEYHRIARYVDNGQIRTLHPLYSPREMWGEYEAFPSDGLRTLLAWRGKVDYMIEYTLRWPGHVEQIHPLIDAGTFVEELQEKCSEGDDLVVLNVLTSSANWSLLDVPKDGLSAMARTTAFSCAAFTEAVLALGTDIPTGVVPPEDLAKFKGFTENVLSYLQERGVCFDRKDNTEFIKTPT